MDFEVSWRHNAGHVIAWEEKVAKAVTRLLHAGKPLTHARMHASFPESSPAWGTYKAVRLCYKSTAIARHSDCAQCEEGDTAVSSLRGQARGAGLSALVRMVPCAMCQTHIQCLGNFIPGPCWVREAVAPTHRESQDAAAQAGGTFPRGFQI